MEASFSSDVNRIVTNAASFSADVWRRMQASTDGLKSLQITLASKTISDTFSMESTVPKNIGVQMKGTFLDFPWNFFIETTAQEWIERLEVDNWLDNPKRQGVQKITGVYDIEETMESLIEFTMSGGTASLYITELGVQLGRAVTKNFDDFSPKSDFTIYSMTYKDAIANLFGWTSCLPHRQINVFLRGNTVASKTLHVVQRFKETNQIFITRDDATQYKFANPQMTRKKIRTLLAKKEESDALSYVVEPVPYTGTVTFGDQTAVYEFGYLVSETHGAITTTYDYSGGYMVKKTADTDDGGKIETTYDYGGYSLDELSVETETTYDSSGNVSSVRVTRHVAAGKGEWVTTVTVDDVLVSSSRSQGRFGGKASIYSEHDANRRLGAKYPADSKTGLKLPGRAVIDTNWPVSDDITLTELIKQTIWLNGKTEERITMDVYGAHVIDFDDYIMFGERWEYANRYCLERNMLSKDPRGFKQSIEIVRWY